MKTRFKRLFPFSDELSGAPGKKIDIQDAKGMTIICDDGIPRRVVEIVHSFRYKNSVIINEGDDHGGHFCHMLMLSAQMLGHPLPTPNQIKSFDDAVKNKIKHSLGGLYDASAPIFK